ncbi:MAG: molybdopterin-dependent oxidoreductase [Anaerolineae bacterium]
MCIQYSRLRQPAPKPEQVSLSLIGLVRTPRVFSLGDLSRLPQHVHRLTLVCAARSLQAKHWETGMWSGVPFTALLDAARVPAEARSVQVAGYDGTVRDFALSDLEHALLALAADGHPLSAAQGYPARLVIPGQTACNMPRFIQRLTFRAEETAPLNPIRPMAVIERVQPIAGGVRLAGQAMVAETVVVRLDDGPAAAVSIDETTPGLAAHWSLVWPGADATTASFSVEPMPLVAHVEPRPLARRWKAQRMIWKPVRSREP